MIFSLRVLSRNGANEYICRCRDNNRQEGVDGDNSVNTEDAAARAVTVVMQKKFMTGG